MIVLNERHLHPLLSVFVAYFHDDRTHLGLAKGTPSMRAAASKLATPRSPAIRGSAVFIIATSGAKRPEGPTSGTFRSHSCVDTIEIGTARNPLTPLPSAFHSLFSGLERWDHARAHRKPSSSDPDWIFCEAQESVENQLPWKVPEAQLIPAFACGGAWPS